MSVVELTKGGRGSSETGMRGFSLDSGSFDEVPITNKVSRSPDVSVKGGSRSYETSTSLCSVRQPIPRLLTRPKKEDG